MAGIAVTLGIAIFSGLLTGFITSRKWFQAPPAKYLFDDRLHWFECIIDHSKLEEVQEGLEQGDKLMQPNNDKHDLVEQEPDDHDDRM